MANDITRDELLARLKLILDRDGSEGSAELLRAVEVQTAPRCMRCVQAPAAQDGMCDACARADAEQWNAEAEAERASEQAYERYLEDRAERAQGYQDYDYDGE